MYIFVGLCLLLAAVGAVLLLLRRVRSPSGLDTDQLRQIAAFVQRGFAYARALPRPMPVSLILTDGAVFYEDQNVKARYLIGHFSGSAGLCCQVLYNRLRSEYDANATVICVGTEIRIQPTCRK